jgi:adenylate cyclase
VLCAERAISLSPFDPAIFSAWMAMGLAHLAAGRYEAGLAWAKKARSGNFGLPALRLELSLCGHLGRQMEADECLRELRKIVPEPTVAGLASNLIVSPELLSRYAEGWRNAGIPEE